MPLPEEETYVAIEDLFDKLNSIHKIFSNSDITSIRLVTNLEKMVIKETQRAYTYLSLYGYNVDSVIVNRTMPTDIDHPFFKQWRESQAVYRKEVEELFSSVPIFEAPLHRKEIMGADALLEFGDSLFAKKDPVSIFSNIKPYEIVKEKGVYNLILKLPFVAKDEVKLHQVADELTIQIENQRRNIFLPGFLAKLNVEKANLEGGVLKITFEKPPKTTKK
jgi:arsenite-transporting ATPase